MADQDPTDSNDEAPRRTANGRDAETDISVRGKNEHGNKVDEVMDELGEGIDEAREAAHAKPDT